MTVLVLYHLLSIVALSQGKNKDIPSIFFKYIISKWG